MWVDVWYFHTLRAESCPHVRRRLFFSILCWSNDRLTKRLEKKTFTYLNVALCFVYTRIISTLFFITPVDGSWKFHNRFTTFLGNDCEFFNLLSIDIQMNTKTLLLSRQFSKVIFRVSGNHFKRNVLSLFAATCNFVSVFMSYSSIQLFTGDKFIVQLTSKNNRKSQVQQHFSVFLVTCGQRKKIFSRRLLYDLVFGKTGVKTLVKICFISLYVIENLEENHKAQAETRRLRFENPRLALSLINTKRFMLQSLNYVTAWCKLTIKESNEHQQAISTRLITLRKHQIILLVKIIITDFFSRSLNRTSWKELSRLQKTLRA